MSLNKEWMKAQRNSFEYLEGVESFIEFIRANKDELGDDDWYCCPCVKCRNLIREKKSLGEIQTHLICDGIDKTYTTWIHHGELHPRSRVNVGAGTNNEDSFPRMVDMVNDVFGRARNEDGPESHVGGSTSICPDEANDQGFVEGQEDSPENIQYKKLMEDAVKPLYPSCRVEHTKLSVTVDLLSMKARYQWSTKSFTELLELIKDILPSENTLPEKTYTAKKMINSLRMECKVIHACKNDCILYWREHKNRNNCPTCGASRWQPRNILKPRCKRLPWKKLRYFPLTQRLQRMYSVSWIAENMTWHANASLVQNQAIMRHPMDSSCWSQVNRKWADFAAEPRNVRLGLATDGFNPFGINSNSYSCWPVMIVPFNLPPSLCMRKEFTMLALLIPGKKGPGHDIDVYLQPLITELEELWSTGAITYDSHTKSMFSMKAILLWAIHDFPAYGHLSGCRTAGKYGCPVCSEGTDSVWLKYGRKFAYMGHRKFLPTNHPFRSQKSQFNGNEEHGKHPRRLTGSEVLLKMETINSNFGKAENKKRKRREEQNEMIAWSKRSIFFDLPYWKDLPIRHNLDVMHVEKNVAEILFATIMNTKDKTKDSLEARQDCKEMKIKKKLWPMENNGKLTCPEAPYALSRREKDLICKTLYHLKVPIGYSVNWRHKVSLEGTELKNIKSHDYHILLQQLLPVLLMHAFQSHKPLRVAIRQLSIFFNVLCSKVINRAELRKMKEKVVETLCVFEKYFPPSFFVSMIHLIVHLAEEAQVCGPVRYRWMYPFERKMKTYKRYVVNQTYPEGSISECYLINEAMLYAMNYMPDGTKKSHKQGRLEWMDKEGEVAYPIDKNGKVYILENVQYQQARKWVLKHSTENVEMEQIYAEYVERLRSSNQCRRGSTQVEKVLEYIPWLRKQLENEENCTLKKLADGPSFQVISYTSYMVNGYAFYTAEAEMNKTTQNSGVTMMALTPFRASAKDMNLVHEESAYYGIMSYDQPSSATASIVQGCSSRESHVTPVTFNIDGQPIGDNAASLSTMIGRSVKNNIPPSFDKWSNVPDVMKEKVWDIVTNKYEIPIDNKDWVLMKENECWRNRKSKLKRNIYSKYHTDVDRKKNVPKFVKKEDWESFIDMCSTYAAQEKSKLGKAARQAMRCPHTSGRKGQARVADELQRKNPDKEITRTDVWLETHTKKDGSASCEETGRVRIIHENNPSLAQGHLDQDPVARVCGRDTRGHVKGMGSGISKYAILRSAPYKRALEREKKSNVTLHTEVEQLKEQMREMQQILASHGGGHMRYSSNHGSSPHVRQDSSRQEAQSDQATTDQSSSPLLKLLHLTKNTCVAYGRQSNESVEESSWKRIILDEIVDGNVDLINGRGKMEDLTPGDAIDWPEFRIISI